MEGFAFPEGPYRPFLLWKAWAFVVNASKHCSKPLGFPFFPPLTDWAILAIDLVDCDCSYLVTIYKQLFITYTCWLLYHQIMLALLTIYDHWAERRMAGLVCMRGLNVMG